MNESHPILALGQHLVMTDGPFQGLGGTLIALCADQRLVLQVDLLRRSIQIEIARHWVAPSERPKSEIPGSILGSSSAA